MKLFLGVDGGQSSTTALVGDENGRVIGMGRGGPCNHARAGEGREKFLGAIAASVGEALGGRPAEFESACLGLSGGPEDKDALAREVVKARQYVITHDAFIALVGATGGEPGVVTIAGTGSIAFGRNSAGRTARAGGWGYVMGDEGGGFDLARQALRAALRHEEGWGPKTSLREALLEWSGARNANDLLHRFYSGELSRSRMAEFGRIVDTAAAGDAVAQEIVRGAAQSLAVFASAVRGQLFESGDAVRISYVGGVFRSAALLARFKMLLELEERTRVMQPKYGPAAGALIEAYRAAGVVCALQEVPPEKNSDS